MADLLSALVPVLGRALLHFLWQGALIGLVAAIALHALRDARPQTRYAIACLALLACVIVPTVGVAMHLFATAGPTATMIDAPATLSVLMTANPGTALVSRFDGSLPWIVMAWAAGACALSLRMGMGLLWVQRLRATPQPPAHAAWQARLDALAVRFGLKRGVALRLVDALDSPVSAGWWRPVVLLPAGLLTRMPTDLIEALLAHELAHVRRHDYLVNLMQSAAEALLFYHPVTWWLSRRIRIEREHIADQLAAQVTGQPRRLALALSELSELAHAHPCSATPHLAQAAHGGHLMSRIEQLIRPGQRMARNGIALPLIGLTAACLAFYAHAQIGQGATTAQATPAPTTTTVAQARTQPDAKPAAHAKAKVEPRATRRHSTDDAYALISKDRDGITMSGSTDDLPEIENARRSLKNSDFVWTRREGKAYIIADATTITGIHDAWRDARKLDEQMEALGEQMEVHGNKMEALGEQMEQLAPSTQNTAAIDAAAQRMEALGQQQAALAAKQASLAANMWRGGDAAEQQKLSAKLDALSEQQDAVGKQMDEQSRLMDGYTRQMERNGEPMEALGRQMEEAGKPMDALGKQMDALGKQHERLTNEAERKTQALIANAIAKGLAAPAPNFSAQ